MKTLEITLHYIVLNTIRLVEESCACRWLVMLKTWR
uniref:Uncharacterized protein n=1 Tax=Anguilla anguilla TaxID=7936 RepID=A0A0E9P5Z2_ANGAN